MQRDPVPKGIRRTKFGPSGEVIRVYPHAVEVWDWIPAALEIEDMDDREKQYEDEQRCLYLVGSLSGLQGLVEDVEPVVVDQGTNTYIFLLTLSVKGETIFEMKKFGQFFKEDALDQSLILPPFVYGTKPYTMKTSDKFLGIATNEGSLTIFNEEKGNPLPQSYDVCVTNNNVLFDIQGRYLCYVLQEPKDQPLTSLIVPSRNPSIYSKILQNLSITALDGIAKLAEFQSMKNALSDKKLSSNLKLYISNLINGYQHPHHVIVIDLMTGKQLAHFAPPNGVQYISLSPFNTQLLTVAQRGDQIYKWDLTRMPLEVSLVDIQTRGKTGSVVQDIHWVTDSVYTMTTRSSGTIHSFGSKESTWIMPNMLSSRVSSNDDELFALVGDELYMFESKGVSNAKFTLPQQPIPRSLLPDHIPVKPVYEVVERTDKKGVIENKSSEPLAQVEIETCFLGEPIYERIQFAYLNDSIDGTFGEEIYTTKIEFGKGCGEAVFLGEKDDLENAMKSVLMLDD